MSSWIQKYSDPDSRVTIRHTGSPRRSWEVDGSYTSFEGRTYPVGARSDQVTDEVNLDTVWPNRVEAEAFLAMLREQAVAVDGRLELHLGAMEDGSPIEMVCEVHQIPEDFAVGKTTVSLTLRRVDGVFTG